MAERKKITDELKESFKGALSTGFTHMPFINAVKRDDVEQVRKMLKKGVKPDVYSLGKAPLHMAVELASPEMVVSLIRNKADINIPMKAANRNTPLDQAILNKRPEMIRLLIGYGAAYDRIKPNGRATIHDAAALNNASAMSAMIDAGADPYIETTNGNNALTLAVSAGANETVRAIAEHPMSSAHIDRVSRKDPELLTALMTAAAEGNLEAAEILIDAGANLEKQSKSGWTAVSIAVNAGHFDIADKLIDAGADFRKSISQGRSNVLHVLAMAKKEDTALFAKMLHRGIDINAQNDDGTTALMLAVRTGKVELTKALLAAGAKPNMVEATGKTALHYAAETENKDMMSALLAHKANPNTVNRATRQPILHEMIMTDLPEMAHMLALSGADPMKKNAQGKDAIALANSKGLTDLAASLKEKASSGVKAAFDGKKQFKL